MPREVRMPVLSQSMAQGQVVEWLVREGDTVKKGDPLVVIDSDKATNELEAPYGGVLRKIIAPVGAEVDVDAPLAIIADEDEPESGGDVGEPAAFPDASTGAPAPTTSPIAPAAPAGRRPVSPVAKRLARELGIDPAQVLGTGAGGLVTEKDVRAFVSSLGPAPSEVGGDEVIPLIGQRGRIAERMALSRRTTADVTTVMDVDMTKVVSRRSEAGFSFTAYVVWSVAQSLREFPLLNSWMADDHIAVKRQIDIGVAVAIEGALVVPVLRHADTKTVEEIDQEINELSARARAGELTPEDMKGGTFTVTNSGAFGSLLFTPIINVPEVAILGMGKIAETPVVRDGEIVVAPMMYLSLSYDHRAVDGAIAVQFLAAVKSKLEEEQ